MIFSKPVPFSGTATCSAHLKIGISPAGTRYNVFTEDKEPDEVRMYVDAYTAKLHRLWSSHYERCFSLEKKARRESAMNQEIIKSISEYIDNFSSIA